VRRACGHTEFGVDHPSGNLQGLATIPEAAWALFLGIYCTVKGFRRSSPILRGDRMRTTPAVSTA
jgi:hypothetical protein